VFFLIFSNRPFASLLFQLLSSVFYSEGTPLIALTLTTLKAK